MDKRLGLIVFLILLAVIYFYVKRKPSAVVPTTNTPTPIPIQPARQQGGPPVPNAPAHANFHRYPGTDAIFGHLGPKEHGIWPYELLGNFTTEKACQDACASHTNHLGHDCKGYTWYGTDYEVNPNVHNACFTAPIVGHSNMSLVGAYSGFKT